MRSTPNSSAVKVTCLYFLLAALWIWSSDLLVERFAPAAETVTNLQTLKGVGFVAVTGVALFLLIRRELARRMRAERGYRRVVEEVKDVLFTVCKEGRFTVLNPAFEKITGFRRTEWMGRHFAEIVHADDLLRLQSLFQQAMRGESIPMFEVRVKSQSGEFLTAEVTVNPEVEEDAVVGLFGVARNVTEQRKVLEGLREKAALLDLTADAILVRDMERRILYWNKGAERLYGWTSEEVLGRKLTDLFIPSQVATRRPEMEAALQATGEWRGERQHVTKSGRAVTVDVRSNVVRGADGQPRGVLNVNSDITERKKLEEQFLNAQRMETIGTLASGIAHDLNNILAPILIASQILPEHVDDPEVRHLFDIIRQSGRRGADVVHQILGFVRGVQGEKFVIQPRHLAREIARFAQETFPKSITFRLGMKAEPWPLLADPSRIYQLLLNLCVNARDAMPKGGTLTLEMVNMHLDEAERKRLGVATAGPHVLMRVKDTGVGIPAVILDKIFEPLFTTKAVGEGTGLGLSTAQMIIKEHGGACLVESEPDKGACFSVYLPASPDAVIQTVSTGTAPAPMGQGELLLVVDDEEGFLALIARTFQNHKYRVITATNGVEAIAKFVEYRDQVRLLITDLEMPLMGGRALILSVRRLVPHLRVLIISGSAGTCTFHEEIGHADYLSKPFVPVDLLNMTRRLLDAGGTSFLHLASTEGQANPKETPNI